MKANYGPAGSQIRMRWERSAFALISASGLGPAVAQAVPQMDDADEQAVVAALADCMGDRLSTARNSPYYAPRVLKARCPAHLRDWSEQEVAGALERLLAQGVVEATEGEKDVNRRPIRTIVVNASAGRAAREKVLRCEARGDLKACRITTNVDGERREVDVAQEARPRA